MAVSTTTLANGLRIVTDVMPHLETTSLGIWVGVGSRHETLPEHGLSHFLEHMAFKGTRRRSARRIAEEIEQAGGDLNAATSTEQTAYYARVLAADTGLALDILADILTDSTFDPAEIAREQEGGAAGDRRGRRHAGRPHLRDADRHRLSRPADRPRHPRHARRRVRLRPGGHRGLSRPALPPGVHDRGRRRRVGTRPHRRRRAEALR